MPARRSPGFLRLVPSAWVPTVFLSKSRSVLPATHWAALWRTLRARDMAIECHRLEAVDDLASSALFEVLRVRLGPAVYSLPHSTPCSKA
jgi:hypothetical protein